MRRTQNFEIWGFKSDTAASFSPLFPFSCHIFLSFAGDLEGFILVGKIFEESF